MESVVTWLLQVGGQAGVLYVAIWFLARQLKEGYDARITSLERQAGQLETRSDECEQDRMQLHEQIHTMQNDRIKLLETLLREHETPKN